MDSIQAKMDQPEAKKRAEDLQVTPGTFGISCRFGLLNACWTVVEQMMHKRQTHRGAN